VINRIDGDGSVVVDGVQYSTSDASVIVNGACATVTDLLVGHVVNVVGQADLQTQLGTADRIVSDDDVAGGIRELDVDQGTLNVIGQDVVITPETVFGDAIRPASLATLSAGEGVAVSGHVGPDGAIIATRIDRWRSSGMYAAGTVSEIDEANGLFRINQILVRYSHAVLVGFAGDRIRNGDPVRIQGTPLGIVPGFGADGGINADAIEYIDYYSITPGVFISGLITRWDTTSNFDVNDHRVTTDSSTKYVGLPFSAAVEPLGEVFVSVFGPIDAQGVLHARLVDTQWSGNLRLQGPVTGIDSQARIVQVMNVPVEVSTSTTMRHVSDNRSIPISFGDLNVGDAVSVTGYKISYLGHVSGLRVEQRQPSNQVYIWAWLDLRTRQEPIFLIKIGATTLTVETTSTTQFYWGHTMPNGGCSCQSRRTSSFWSFPVYPGPGAYADSLEVFGAWNGDHIIADRVYWVQL